MSKRFTIKVLEWGWGKETSYIFDSMENKRIDYQLNNLNPICELLNLLNEAKEENQHLREQLERLAKP